MTQNTARIKAHSRVVGGRSHDGVLANDIRGMTDGETADGGGVQSANGVPMGLANTDSPED